tara:strand:- start:1525 stop:1938 length:414 start_codon:yes stop_codon:yes gene_type:complete
MATSFKKELLEGIHDFRLSGGDDFKIALYTSSATLSATTTAYTATNEVAGTAYVAQGSSLTRVNPSTTGTSGITDFADVTWGTATITARGALIYNETTAGDEAVVILDFGADKVATSGDFTVVFPTAAAGSAIIEIA